MNIVIRHIEFLISRKNCVIIPGVGAILAHSVNAEVDPATGIILPPSRTYSFNSDLSVSDGMLVASVARACAVSYDTAARRVEQATGQIMKDLKSNGRFTLGSLGTLLYNESSHTVSFEASVGHILSASTLWLDPVTLPGIDTVSAPLRRGTPIHIVKGSYLKKALRVAASIALLIGVCFVSSTPLPINDATLASLSPELRQLEPSDFHTQAPVKPLTIIRSVAKEAEAPISVYLEDTTSYEKYMVVVGTLRNKAEAELFCKQHQSHKLHIYPNGKYFNVYSAAYKDRKEAVTACRSMLRAFPDAWICKK